MADGERPYTFDRVVRLALSAATLAVVLLTLRYLSDVLIPFALAVVLAYLINPVVTLFEERMQSRAGAVGIVLAGLAVVGITLILVLGVVTADQIGKFSEDLRGLRNDFAAGSGSGQDAVGSSKSTVTASSTDAVMAEEDSGGDSAEKSASGFSELRLAWYEFRANEEGLGRDVRLRVFRDRIHGTLAGTMLDSLIDYLESPEFDTFLVDAFKSLIAGGATVVAFLLSTAMGVAGLIIVLIYLVFLLLDFPDYSRSWHHFLPPSYRSPIVGFLTEFNEALRRYFRGQTVVAMITGVLFSIGFMIIGLPMAVPLGMFIGLLNMVPYLQTIGLVPAFVLAVMRCVQTDSSLLMMLFLVLVVFGVCQLIQDAFVTPRIMGKATGLRPVAILLGVFIWGKLLGFLGLILAIPLTCLGIAYYRRFVLESSTGDSAGAAENTGSPKKA